MKLRCDGSWFLPSTYTALGKHHVIYTRLGRVALVAVSFLSTLSFPFIQKIPAPHLMHFPVQRTPTLGAMKVLV